MTYLENMALQEQPASAELYVFTLGSTVYRYTSYHRDLTYDSNPYNASPIRRSGFTISYDMTPAECQITMVSNSDLITALKLDNGTKPLTVEITRVFLGDDTNSVLYSGSMVGGFSIVSKKCTIKFRDILHLLDREIARVRVQSLCNNQLYDGVCGIAASGANKVTATVTVSADGQTLTSATFATKADDFFKLGKLVYGDYTRMITYHIADTIKIYCPINGLATGASVDAYAGCDKHPQTCIDKFDNIAQFVGMPYVPWKDPLIRPITNA